MFEEADLCGDEAVAAATGLLPLAYANNSLNPVNSVFHDLSTFS